MHDAPASSQSSRARRTDAATLSALHPRSPTAPQDVADLHGCPRSASGCLDAARRERLSDATQAADTGGLDFLDDRPDIGGKCVSGRYTSCKYARTGLGQARVAQFDTTRLGSRQRGPRALRDRLALI
jgi:hypothetical protein